MKAAILSSLLLASAAQAAADPAKFNDAVNATYVKLNKAGVDIGAALKAWSGDPKTGVTALKKAYEAMEKTLADVRADSKTWEIPDSDEAKAFFAAYGKFLDAQEAVVKALGKLVGEAEKVGDKGIDKETLQKAFDEIGDIEKTAVKEVDEKQQAFIKKHGLKAN